MSLLAPFFRRAGNLLIFKCPGCKQNHAVTVKGDEGPIGPEWSWNGSADKPTFRPSILVTGTEHITDEEAERVMRGEKLVPRPFKCHSYVTDGQIQFLDDCTHSLKNQTVPLVPWPGGLA